MEKKFVAYIIRSNKELKRILKDNRYSPGRLAKKMGIGTSTIYDLLNDKFNSLDLLVKASVCLCGLPVASADRIIKHFQYEALDIAKRLEASYLTDGYQPRIEGVTCPLDEEDMRILTEWEPHSVDNNDE